MLIAMKWSLDLNEICTSEQLAGRVVEGCTTRRTLKTLKRLERPESYSLSKKLEVLDEVGIVE